MKKHRRKIVILFFLGAPLYVLCIISTPHTRDDETIARSSQSEAKRELLAVYSI